MDFRCLIHGPASGVRNMAVDEALMAGARRGALTLRFYAWEPACLSLGRNQRARDRYDLDRIRSMGLDVVRRPTGGRAVHHDRELTYAVAAPADAWGSLRESYARINRALLAGLAGLGVPAGAAGAGGGAPRPSTRACFRDPLP
ncbi:MAG: lipoate--protein ligase family protein, partial [Gemmatimonadota bacterium]